MDMGWGVISCRTIQVYDELYVIEMEPTRRFWSSRTWSQYGYDTVSTQRSTLNAEDASAPMRAIRTNGERQFPHHYMVGERTLADRLYTIFDSEYWHSGRRTKKSGQKRRVGVQAKSKLVERGFPKRLCCTESTPFVTRNRLTELYGEFESRYDQGRLG